MIPNASKQALRQRLRSERDGFVRGLDPSVRAELQSAAVARLLDVLGNGIWASYLAIGSEIDPAEMASRAPSGQPIAYPWFADRHATMIFRLGNAVFTRGPFGISQPDVSQPVISPDWIIMPLVGVDIQGNRIGQGAGHYDRVLASLRLQKNVRTIGLAWDVQLIDSIESDPWDQPLDLIVTPGRTIEVQA